MNDSAAHDSWVAVRQLWLRILDRLGRSGDLPGPSTRESIAAAEARLGITLPQVLDELYRMSDGLPILQSGDVYGIRGAAELVWFRDVESELITIWEDINQGGELLRRDIDLMRRGLAVSKGGDEYRLLLVPNVDPESADPRDWVLYRQTNSGDGVMPEMDLADHLLQMLSVYYSDDVR